MRLKVFILLALISLSVLVSRQFSQPAEPAIFTGIAMTIPFKVIVGEAITEKQREQVLTTILTVFDATDSHFNKYNPESELSKLNKLAAGAKVELSKELETLLVLTDKLVRLTEGRFDPTIEPLQKLWKERMESGHRPSEQEIELIADAIGWHNIHIENGFFWKDRDDTMIDLGGIAKGYCVDCLSESLAEKGFASSYVEWGGEIRTRGEHPDSRPWKVFISDLGDENPENALALVSMTNHAIATSGDYLQNWEIEESEGRKVRYTHILDVLKKRPLELKRGSIACVSIVSEKCAIADAIATAAMLYESREEAEGWLATLKSEGLISNYWIKLRESD